MINFTVGFRGQWSGCCPYRKPESRITDYFLSLSWAEFVAAAPPVLSIVVR